MQRFSNSGIRTKTGNFVMHPHFRKASNTFQNARVCLATFSSVSKLFWLVWQMQGWEGPISVAVYTPGTDFQVLAAIIDLFDKCIPQLHSKVSYHVLYLEDQPPSSDSHSSYILNYKCSTLSNFFEYLKNHLSKEYPDGVRLLPQNHLRNLARQTCATPFALNIDVDMIPSLYMHQKLSSMLRDDFKNMTLGLITPVYEVDSSQNLLPGNKAALLKMLKSNKAQRFHVKVGISIFI